MKFKTGSDRSQIALIPTSLEAAIDKDNEVRVIDAFVDSLDLSTVGFQTHRVENGRPAYHPSDLLKLYIYGYMNKIRSSRDLEKECSRNIEVMWLLKSLAPDHNTISNFRRDNKKAIKSVFRSTIEIAKHFDLIGGKLVAGDSTKLRAQNSKKHNYNKKKIDKHLHLIEENLNKYNALLAEADGDEKTQIQQEIDKYQQRKQAYKELDKQLDNSGEKQISTADPDSRNIMIRNNICEVAYSVQTTVDEKNKLPIDYKVTNQNDAKAMGPMLESAKDIIGHNHFTALYDKGYHTGSEIKAAQDMGIETIVAIPDKPGSNRAPAPHFNSDRFIYNKEADTYTCPEGETLTTTGAWYKVATGARVKHYKTKACKNCPARDLCTTSKKGRLLSRSEHQEQYESNQRLFQANYELYKQRQQIVEHPFGTIKRQWGFSYILTKKGINRASADVGLMFVAYNLKRLLNIIGKEGLQKYLRELIQLTAQVFMSPKQFSSFLSSLIFKTKINKLYFSLSLNPI